MASDTNQQIEGEGNKSADQNYREAAEKHADTDDNRKAAQKAEEAIEGAEGEELEKARESTASHEPGSSH